MFWQQLCYQGNQYCVGCCYCLYYWVLVVVCGECSEYWQEDQCVGCCIGGEQIYYQVMVLDELVVYYCGVEYYCYVVGVDVGEYVLVQQQLLGFGYLFVDGD